MKCWKGISADQRREEGRECDLGGAELESYSYRSWAACGTPIEDGGGRWSTR